MGIVVATSNPGKLAEFAVLISSALSPRSIDVISIGAFAADFSVDETGESFADNAILMAVEGCRISGLPCLADDSGLCVDALGGAPGVSSARWLGPDATDEERNLAILRRLEGKPDRSASYVCAVCLAFPDGTHEQSQGVCYGLIGEAESGSGGFGYDPIFYRPEEGRTVAQMTSEEKNRISHRGAAIRLLFAGMSDSHRALLF